MQDGCSEEGPPHRGNGKGGQPPPGPEGFGGAAGKQEVGKGMVEAGVLAEVGADPGGSVAVLPES